MSQKIMSVLLFSICSFSSVWAWSAVKEYHLDIAESKINLTGQSVKRITVNGQFPAPTLNFEEGDDAVIHVHNRLKNQDSSVHWHGLLLPGIMDGVPGMNGFQGIRSHQDFVYRFKIRQSGTYWYHAHSMGQEQDGLYGALIIQPKQKARLNPPEPSAQQQPATQENLHDRHTADPAADAAASQASTTQDYVVMLSDFHLSSAAQILANLKKDADYYQNRRETVFDVFRHAQRSGLKATWKARAMWNNMRMYNTDLSDVTGYHFLMNGQTTQQAWRGKFQPKQQIRLRFINASAMTMFDVRIPGLKMTVVSADGQAVEPVVVDEFRIGNAETYDVLVEPTQQQYQIEAESIDRAGFAIGVLSQLAQPLPVVLPKARPRAQLSMADMGHGSDSMSTSTHSVTMTSHQHGASQTAEPMTEQQPHQRHSDQTQMAGMMSTDHLQHQQTHQQQHQNQSQYQQQAVQMAPSAVVKGWANASTPVGMRALRYQDLKTLKPQQDIRAPEHTLNIELGGNMERYIWTINGKKFNQAEPLNVKYGDRVRLIFKNDSMMAHPMHLHGMFMQLENGQASASLPNKHTIIVPPGQTVSALLTANELGEWAIHCHLLYHMSSGMMSKLVVANVSAKAQSSTATQPMSEASNQGAAHEHH